MRESYAPVLLDRKTKRLRKETQNPKLRSALDKGRDRKSFLLNSIIRPLKFLVFSPIVFLLSLYMAILYSYLYLLFITFPRVFEGQYMFSSSSVGLTYLGVGVGSFLGLVFAGAVSDRILKALIQKNGGEAKPEYRLPTMLIGAVVVPIGLFLYGWAAEKHVHYIVPIIGSGFLGAGLMLTFVRTLQPFLINGDLRADITLDACFYLPC